MEPGQKPSYAAAFQAVASPKDMVNLAYAEGYLNSIHVGVSGHDGALAAKKERERDNVRHISNAVMQSYQQASHRLQASLDGLESGLDDARRQFADMKQDIEDNTVTLSDGTKAYYNLETGRFETQDAEGQWKELDAEGQEEALTRAGEQGGHAATRQAKEFADQMDESLAAIEVSHDEMSAELDEIDRAVEEGRLSREDATDLKESLYERSEERVAALSDLQREMEQMPAYAPVRQEAERESALSAQEDPERARKGTVSAFADPDYKSALCADFRCAASGTHDDGPAQQDIAPEEPSAPAAVQSQNQIAFRP